MLTGKTVALDFDGVLNEYQGWKEGALNIPEPKPGALEFLRTLKEELQATVIIFTCREVREVWNWLEKHRVVPYVTNVTNLKPPAYCYVDDRGIGFQGDFTAALEAIKTFEPYWKKDTERLWLSRQHDGS